MKGTRRAKKGALLAEACVALAVVAIISTLVLSFTLLVNRRVIVCEAKTAFMEDVVLTKAMIEPWFEKNQDKNQEFIDENLVFTDKTLTVEGTSVVLETVTNVTFEVLKNETDSILFVAMTYQLPYQGDRKDMRLYHFTFCVNPRVGDTVTVQVQGGAA